MSTASDSTQIARVFIGTLTDLWVHTGTACNLECPFCLEGSKPGDTRLERPTLAELQPYLTAAIENGVSRFVFTGGEPLIVKDIVKILDYALARKPCTVFTNGTAPLIKRVHQLQALQRQAHPLLFRISIDHPDEQTHDAARGWGNFKRAIDGVKALQKCGFDVTIARHQLPGEDKEAVEKRYRNLFRKQGLSEDLLITALPEFGLPGTGCSATPLSAHELIRAPHNQFQCASSRMLVKRAGELSVMACPLVDDDLAFDLGRDLTASLASGVTLRHQRCRQCLVGNRY